MEKVDFIKLYKLQDLVLDTIFEEETEFYLTGGTCLNRFHYEARYSDDLDFFTNFSSTFHYSIKAIETNLNANNFQISKKVESKDFVRLSINNMLQVDFVNDRVKKIGGLEIKGKLKLDNYINILSNKVTAVLSRDSAKDVFDILLICHKETFDWKRILQDSKEKMLFDKEDLAYRLSNFPNKLFSNIKIIDKSIIYDFEKKINSIVDDILTERTNSLNHNAK